MIDQAKFTYSSLGKTFDKPTRAIKDQREKQADNLKASKPKELYPKKPKPIEYGYYFINGLAEIRDSSKIIDFNGLTYNITDDSAQIRFIGFKGLLHIFESIYNSDIALDDVKKVPKKLKSYLGRIKNGPPYYNLLEQLNTT